MAIEYIVGPVLALLVSMKFTAFKSKEQTALISALETKIELLEKGSEELETELPKKVMATMLPVAKAVQKLNEQVGL